MDLLKKISGLLSSLFVLIVIVSCNNNVPFKAINILSQLPDNKRIVLIPNELNDSTTANYKTIVFKEIVALQDKNGNKFSEDGFYETVRSLGVQYILVSSEMTNKKNNDFPWMTNKNFRVCPGNIDHGNEMYYTLLVWDNSKSTYHFFKFLYEDNR